jgi:hypothetical protein
MHISIYRVDQNTIRYKGDPTNPLPPIVTWILSRVPWSTDQMRSITGSRTWRHERIAEIGQGLLTDSKQSFLGTVEIGDERHDRREREDE